MKVISQLRDLNSADPHISLAIGFFDGVHRGHQRLIARAQETAKHSGGTAWVMTFEPHPVHVLRPDSAPPLLSPLDQKLDLLRSYGIDGCIVLPFTRATARIEPETFVSQLLSAAPPLHHVYVGQNWRFGHARRGSVRMLSRLARRDNVAVTAVRPVLHHGVPVSSTRIREAVLSGEVMEAATMLGRPYGIEGRVTRGAGIGRRLGYPTANVQTRNDILPPFGIYAARGHIDGQSHDGIVSYGIRPTFSRDVPPQPLVEIHLFDLEANLYDKRITVDLYQRIRDEWEFGSTQALVDQIRIDVECARQILK